MSTVKNQRILFVLYGYPLGVSTMLINAIAMLKENGNQVSILANDAQQKDLPCDSWLNDLFVPMPGKAEAGGAEEIKKCLKKIKPLYGAVKCFKKMLESSAKKPADDPSWERRNSGIFDFAEVLRKYLSEHAVDVLMPVECFSLIACVAALEKLELDKRMIYFDMELLDWAPENPLYTDKLELKRRQFEALRRVERVVITSYNRARIFAEINQFPPDRISVLPVVPRKRDIQKPSVYFRDKFSIGSDKTLVIYTGNLMPWAQCLEIIESMKNWPPGAVLVMHTWNKGSLSTEYFQKLQRAAEKRPVYFSSDYLRYDEMQQALTSADIGLLYYQDIDDNFTEIFLSSNKMAEYLAAGLPLVCSPHESLKDFVDRNGIGFAVDFDGIGGAIETIAANRGRYSENVKVCCEKYFIFDKYFKEAFDGI